MTTEKINSNKIKVLWALLCQNASVDQQTNTVSLFGIIEQINLNQKTSNPLTVISSEKLTDFPEKKIIPVKATLVIQMEREDTLTSSAGIKVEILDPSGEVLGTNEFPVEAILNEKKRLRAIVNIEGLPVTKSGKYTFAIFTKSKDEKVFQKQYSTSIEINIFA